MKTVSIEHYGTFRGGDPRQFIPDTQVNTPQQMENWRAFCNIWAAAEAAGETLAAEPAQHGSPENSQFGVGFQGGYNFEFCEGEISVSNYMAHRVPAPAQKNSDIPGSVDANNQRLGFSDDVVQFWQDYESKILPPS